MTQALSASMMLRTVFLILSILLLAAPAYANAGLPMIAFAMPAMAISLVPIILLESWYIRRALNVATWPAFKTMIIVNLESTLIGIPLTWVAWVLIEMAFGFSIAYVGEGLNFPLPDAIGNIFAVTIGAAWLAPEESALYWMVPTASLVLLIPFFYVSYFLERGMAKRLLKGISAKDIYKAIFNANLYSYGLLSLIVICWLIVSLITKAGT